MSKISTTPGYVGALVTGHIEPRDKSVEAVFRACDTMPHSKLVSTIPMGELIAFSHALLRHVDGVREGGK